MGQENKRRLWSMFCEHCGSTIHNDAAFCKSCGKALDRHNPHHKPVADGLKDAGAGRRVSPNIVVDQNGAMSWAYELSFWKSPVILITLSKVLMLSLAFPLLLTFFLALEDGIAEAARIALTMTGIAAAVLIGLLGIAYLLVGLSYGGKYQVLFRMDDEGVHHIQLDKQYDRAAAMGLLTSLVGLAGGNLTAAGAGLMGAARQSQYTTFSAVRSIRINERRNVIYVNETLSRNQVYAGAEDFAVVRDFIVAHCPRDVRIR